MDFLRRLKYYLIGVGLGILLVLAIFKDRKLTAWMPENQVKKEFAEKEILYPEELKCRLKCHGLMEKDELESLLVSGVVYFSDRKLNDFK